MATIQALGNGPVFDSAQKPQLSTAEFIQAVADCEYLPLESKQAFFNRCKEAGMVPHWGTDEWGDFINSQGGKAR